MTKEITKTKNADLEISKSERRISKMREAIDKVTNIFFEIEEAKGIYEQVDKMGEAWADAKDAKNEKKEKAFETKMHKLNNRLAHIKLYPWENLSYLALSGKEDTAPITDLRSAFIQEYGPKTATELALIEGMAISHYNFIRNTGVLNSHLMSNIKDENLRTLHFDALQMKAAKEASKAADMAYRQFTNSIILLKEIRQPKLNIHVKTENAYLAKNQQVINIERSDKEEDENH